MRRVMGEEWCEQYAERILKAQKDRDADLSDRVFASIQELYNLSARQVLEAYHGATKGDFSQIEHDTKGTHVSLSSTSSIDTDARNKVWHAPDDEQLELTGDETIDALIRKVQSLEAKIRTNDLEDRFRRVKQSGIANRAEDSMVDRWQKLLNDDKQTSNAATAPETALSFIDMILEQSKTMLSELTANLSSITSSTIPPKDQDQPNVEEEQRVGTDFHGKSSKTHPDVYVSKQLLGTDQDTTDTRRNQKPAEASSSDTSPDAGQNSTVRRMKSLLQSLFKV